jgi:hypothetical protein
MGKEIYQQNIEPFNETVQGNRRDLGIGGSYLVTSSEVAKKSLTIAGVSLVLTAGAILNKTSPAFAKSIHQEITEIANGLNTNAEIKGVIIGAGITCLKEFIESPKEFIQSLYTLRHPQKTMEVVGNVVCGGIVGATIADAGTLVTSESSISLSPVDAKRLVIESVLSIPATAVIIATTDRIKNWMKSTAGTITGTIESIPETRARKNNELEKRHAMKDYRSNNLNRQEQGRKKLKELGIDPKYKG